MPSTSVPVSMSSSASELPKRPRPITATESASAIRRALVPNRGNLANGGPLLRIGVQDLLVAQREGGAQRERAEPAQEHQQDEHHLGCGLKVVRDAGRE